MERTVLIAGPTASGKSRLALDLATSLNGVIINADSMQVYQELRVLTARPNLEQEAIACHRLYGIIPARTQFSVRRWLDLAITEIEIARSAGKVPIVVGGTGLYLQALTEGIAVIPDIPEDIRRRTRDLMADVGVAGVYDALKVRDPVMANRLKSTDSQRLVRALEVIEGTGISLAEWQARKVTTSILPGNWQGFILNWPRSELYNRCDRRLEQMLEHGALDEVNTLMDLNLDPSLPVMKALGVPVLIKLIRGEVDRASALASAQQATRRYAKRQTTWFENKMCSWNRLNAQDSESLLGTIISFMSKNMLTASN